MKRAILAILTVLLSAALAGRAAEPVRFKRISVGEGLSQSTVLDIAQDARGYFWVATSDGLNRYDGYDFTVWRHIPGDTSSLGGNTIHSLHIDPQGVLWAGTANGLSRYQAARDEFHSYTFRGESMQVYDICDAGASRLLLATDVGVLLFDAAQGSFTIKAPSGTADYRLVRPYGQDVLVGGMSGLALYSTAFGTVTPVVPELCGMDISDIVNVPGRGVWVATFGGGLYRLDESLQVERRYRKGDTAGALGSDYIRVLAMQGDNKLWVGTFDGLNILDTRTGRFENYTYSSDDGQSLSQNSIRSIYIDSYNGVWLGTYYGGLNYYHPMLLRFGSIQHHAGHNSLSDNTVSCIVEQEGTGNLWIGTNDGGLNYFDLAAGRWRSYRAGNGSLASNNIKCVLEEGPGTIWVGTHAGGLGRLDPRTGAVRNYVLNSSRPSRNSCYCLLDEGGGKLWVGTLCGLLLLDKATGAITPHPYTEEAPRLKVLEINSLMRDSRSRVWICTNRGVFMRPAGGKVRSYESLPLPDGGQAANANVISVTEDSRGNIWLGSDQGLLHWVEDKSCFELLTSREGLPNDFVYGSLEDGMGRLWISTNHGLSCYDPFEKAFRNYGLADGVVNQQFNRYSFCRSAGGVMYFGGISGITFFDPAALADNPYSPQGMVTGFTLLNRDASRNSDAELDKDSAGALKSVEFPSRYSVFGIRFVVINPVAGGNNTFSYTLEGFDDEWYETRNREVSYSNLPPGHYKFRLRSCNNDGVWAEKEATLRIYISPMWYQTTLARLLYVLFGLAVVFFIIRFYLEHIDRKRIEQVGQEKVRFYVNLSHELRTPLTLILSPLDELRSYHPEDRYLSSRVGLIRRNATKLLHMVNQLLEYSKAESGILRVQVAPEDPARIVSDIFTLFEEAAYDRDIDYMIDLPAEQALYPVDRSFLERILMNLLSNAFKFTPDGGTIKVSLTREGDNLLLGVRNSGEGVSPEEREKIFERFYKSDESRPGTGIGLSIVKRLAELHHGTVSLSSEPEAGTEFSVSLPAAESAYAPGERAADGHGKPMPAASPEFYIEQGDPETPAAVPGDGKRETLLIVEDNPEIKGYLSASFRDRYNIMTASEGGQALAIIHDQMPDIIITDLMMPGMDGLKLVQSIKQNIQTCHIPVIILTAKDSPEEQIRGMEAGADDYLTKPFSIPMLTAKVNNLIKSKYRLLKHYSGAVEVEPEKIAHNPIDGEFLRRAVRVVEDNLSNVNFSTDLFAEAMHMSRSGLHLKMKSLTGESTINFIRKIRLGHACRLIEQGANNITEISEMTGFSSSSYFTTTFKKHLGCLPTEYARQKKVRGQVPEKEYYE